VAKYAIDIKPSGRRELENLSDNLIARLVPKMMAWPPIQDHPAAGNYAVTRISGASASGITASCTSSTTTAR